MDGNPSQLVNPSLPALPARWETAQKASAPWALLFLALAIGIFIEFRGPIWAQGPFRQLQVHDWSGWIDLACAGAVAVLFHEAGHLLPAMALDFEVLGFSLGPFRTSRLHGKWCFGVSLGRLFSASVSAVPRDTMHWRRRMLIVVAGGPAATFLTGAISSLLISRAPAGSWLSSFLAALTQISFFIFILGLLPNHPRARIRNDARQFLLILRNTPEASAILLYHLVVQLQCKGVRPRHYPQMLIERLAVAQARPDVMCLYAQVIASWALDRGDLASAAAWTHRALQLSDGCDPKLKNPVLAASACFDVTFGDDLESAKKKFGDVRFDALLPESFMHRAKAAYFLSTGNVAEAIAEVSRADFALPKALPHYAFERALLIRLHRRALGPDQLSRPAAC